jgi:uncharacterized protein (DUF362 family)
MPKSKVAVALDPDRSSGARKVVQSIGLPDLESKVVLIKPNLNTADEPPGSTHVDTLRAVFEMVKAGNPSRIIVGDRSGPVNTREVFKKKGLLELADELGFEHLIFDEMPDNQWVRMEPKDGNWRSGIYFARPVLDAGVVITLCCLKTHHYGGHFSMSLKVAVGMVHRRNMMELHSSLLKQRRMIAETNLFYKPAIAVMDGVEAFYSGGPMKGARWKADLTFASTDRVALDAVGVAALKMHGTTRHLENKPIFEQDQIKRAAELGLGVARPEDIEIVPVDDHTKEIADRIRDVLLKG